MRVTVNKEMKEWVADYIREHRKDGTISLHVVFSNFNEDFKKTFGVDPVMIVNLMIKEGFLKGMPALKGFSIWLPEDSGKGQSRPFRSRPKAEVATDAVAEVKNVEKPVVPTAQTGDVKMKMIAAKIEPSYEFEFLSNPETGEVGILALLDFIMRKLGEKMPSKPVMDGSYVVVKMDLFPSLSDMGLPREKFDSLSRILQEMGLIRKYPKSQWAILHPKAYEYFITPTLYNVAKDAMKWRDQRNSEIAKLRQKVASLTQLIEGQPESVPTLLVQSTEATSSFENEAIDALAEAERLSEELTRVNAKLAEVQVECDNVTLERNKLSLQLQERPAAAEIVKKAFHERLQAVKLARV